MFCAALEDVGRMWSFQRLVVVAAAFMAAVGCVGAPDVSESPLDAVSDATGSSLDVASINAIAEAGREAISSADLARLEDQCRSGDLLGCDVLSLVAEVGTELHDYAQSCGERGEPQGISYCVVAHGQDDLEALTKKCQAGDFGACDILWASIPFGHPDEEVTNQCGGAGEPDLIGFCVYTFGLVTR